MGTRGSVDSQAAVRVQKPLQSRTIRGCGGRSPIPADPGHQRSGDHGEKLSRHSDATAGNRATDLAAQRSPHDFVSEERLRSAVRGPTGQRSLLDSRPLHQHGQRREETALIDKRRTLRRFEPLFTFAADYYLLISSFFFVVILADGARRGDARMRAEVNLAVYKATADIGHLFRNYTATQSFSDKEILELSKRELRDAVQSWTSTIPSRVTLQVIALRENTLFDSYHDQLLPYRP